MIDYFGGKYRQGSINVRREIQLKLNKVMRRHQKAPPLPPKVTSSVPVIIQDAFANFRPSGNMKKKCWGKNSEEYHHSMGDFSYDPVAGSIQARIHAVRTIVNNILDTGDDNQIALTLMFALKHHLVKPNLKRITS